MQPEAKALAPLGDLAMLARCGDALERPLPARPGEGKIISIGWTRRVFPLSAELHSTRSEPASTPAPAKPAKRSRRARRRWGANAAVLMAAAALMMMSFAVVVMALKMSGWMRSGDGAAQTDGQGGQGHVNEAGKTQALTKPPPPLKDQKRPPCEPKYETEMGGGCWQSAPSKTCTDNGFKWNGKCYVPVLPDSGPPVADP